MTEALTEQQQPTTTNTTTTNTTTRIDGDDHEESTVSLMDQLLTQHSTVILFACHFNTCIENSVDQQEQQHDSEVTWMTIQTRDGSKLDQCTVRVASTSTTEASSSSSSNEQQQQQQQQDENESSVIVVTSLSQVMQKFDQYLYEKYIRDKSEFCLVLYDSAEQLYSKHGLYHMAESLGIRLAAHYQSFYDLKNILVLNNNNNNNSSSNDDDSDVNNNNSINNSSNDDDNKLNDTISKCKQMQQVFISKHNQIVQHSQEKIKNFKLSVESPEWTGRIASTTKPISTPVIRLRGLPWTCSEEDIAEFFAGRKLASKSLNPSFASSYAASLNEKELQESEQQEQPQEEGEEKLENEQESVSGENKQQQQQQQEEAVERHETVDNENNQEEQVVDLIEAKDASDANVLLVLNSYGRATGEAYVEFVSVAEAKLAFDKDRATMKHRYIEIFASSKHEMEQVRCGIEHDLGALGDSTVIRMRGLPYKANVSHIEQFFDGLEIGTFPRRSRSQPNGQVVYHKKILIVIGQDGKSTGDAYVEFVDVSVLKEALKRNKEKIFNRYIELFRSTIAEMNAARLYSKRYSYQYQIQQQQQQQPGMEYAPVYNGYPPHPQQPYRRYPRQHHNNGNYQPEYMAHQMGYYENDNNNNEVNEMDEQQQHDEQLVVSDHVVRLTNLSIQFDEKYIAELFSILGIEIVPQGIHLVIDDNEVSTGEAFVELYSEDDVDTAVLSLTETLKADGAQVTKSSAQELVSPSNSLSPEETGETYDSSLESEHQQQKQQQEEHIVEEEVQSDVQYREYSQQQSQGYHNHHHQQHHHYQNRQQHHYPQQQQQQQHKPHYHYSNYHQRSNYNHHNHHNGNYHYHNNNRSQQYHHHYNNANHYHQHQYAGIPQYQQEQEMNGYNQQPQNAYVEQLDYSSGGMQPQQQYHHYKPRRGNYRGGGAQRHTTQRHNNNYQGTYYHSHQQPYHPTASEHETNTSPE